MASAKYGVKKTLEPTNQFSIICPVFKAQTKLASCFALRDLWARGEPPATRRGCQVALSACKCPVDLILAQMIRNGDDPYHSVEAKVGTLSNEILERIAPVLILEKAIERAELSPQERKLLYQANDDAHNGVKSAVKKSRRADPTAAELDAIMPMEEAELTNGSELDRHFADAAKTGDMTAAINEEIKGATT